jgi:UPF0755 protein
MKKIFLGLLLIGAVLAAILSWIFLGSATTFNEKRKYLFVYSGKADKASVINSLEQHDLVKNTGAFEWLANRMSVWDKLRPGRYEIKKGESLLSVARMLRNNRQSPVDLVIKKVRTNEDLARLISKHFEADSVTVLDFVSNPDSLQKLGVDENTLMTLIIPNTYTLFWNTKTGRIFQRLKSEKESFWNKNNRMSKAQNMGFTPQQIYTIASIVEEETNKQDEKGNVASVYINRYEKGMRLGADPTVKFALKDFGLKRIYEKHLQVQSPYNTYRNSGLPPGPICTPSPKTIDAVLDAPKTDYYYFVAKSDFSGYHTFSRNYAEHLKNAKEYQKALDELILRKQNSSKASL